MRLRSHVCLAALSTAVALVQFRILILLFGPDYRLSVEAAEGVLRGEPHWRLYQSRLLGPAGVQLFEPISGSYLGAHALCSILLLALAGYLTLRLAAGSGEARLVSFLVLSLLVVATFQKPWLYIWDLVDLVLFVLFNAFVARHRDVRVYAALVAVALLNRESALYLALWMVLDPLVRWVLDRRAGTASARLDWSMIAVGAALLVGGWFLIEGIRGAMLVREVGPSLVGEVAGARPAFHWMLQDNLQQLGAALTSFRYSMSFLVPLGVLAYLIFAARVAWRDPRGCLASAVVHVLLLLSTLCFGLVFETRVYMALLPFVALHLAPDGRG